MHNAQKSLDYAFDDIGAIPSNLEVVVNRVVLETWLFTLW
jgi:hypothetical protein